MGEKENEKLIQSFGDLVEANEKLTKPWRKFCAWLIVALIATNMIWGFVHWKQLQYAYQTPTEMTQSQDFEAQLQSQHQSEGATNG